MLSPEELVNKLKKINWKTLYEEHYGKNEIDKELPKGKDLQKHFYNSEDWFNRINKNTNVVSKNSIKKNS